jgi:hypothetical protein
MEIHQVQLETGSGSDPWLLPNRSSSPSSWRPLSRRVGCLSPQACLRQTWPTAEDQARSLSRSTSTHTASIQRPWLRSRPNSESRRLGTARRMSHTQMDFTEMLLVSTYFQPFAKYAYVHCGPDNDAGVEACRGKGKTGTWHWASLDLVARQFGGQVHGPVALATNETRGLARRLRALCATVLCFPRGALILRWAICWWDLGSARSTRWSFGKNERISSLM